MKKSIILRVCAIMGISLCSSMAYGMERDNLLKSMESRRPVSIEEQVENMAQGINELYVRVRVLEDNGSSRSWSLSQEQENSEKPKTLKVRFNAKNGVAATVALLTTASFDLLVGDRLQNLVASWIQKPVSEEERDDLQESPKASGRGQTVGKIVRVTSHLVVGGLTFIGASWLYGFISDKWTHRNYGNREIQEQEVCNEQ